MRSSSLSWLGFIHISFCHLFCNSSVCLLNLTLLFCQKGPRLYLLSTVLMLRFDFDLRPLLLVVIPSILAFFGLLLARLDIVLNKHVRVYIRFCQNSMSFLHNLIILALRWRSIALTDFSGGFFFALLVHLVLCLSKLFIIFRFADGLPSFCGFTGLGILQFGWTYCTN